MTLFAVVNCGPSLEPLIGPGYAAVVEASSEEDAVDHADGVITIGDLDQVAVFPVEQAPTYRLAERGRRLVRMSG